jgi:hypothetical protein
MEIPTGLLKLVGVITGSMMTFYYLFNLITATVANWTIYKTLPSELKKQTEILEKILKRLEGEK